MLTAEQVRQQLADLERFVEEEYKPAHSPKKRDWRTYEEQWAHRLRQVMRNLGPLIHEACAFYRGARPGPEPTLTLEQKVQLLLIKILHKQSNRRMAGMLVTFSLLSGLDVSYKTVERLYSDPEVATAVTNLHTLMMRRRGVRVTDVTGDGTGFTLSITQHYATTATKEKERAKENSSPASEAAKGPREGMAAPSGKKVHRFVYSFRLLDLRTWLYVAFGTSLRSERAAYDASLAWLTVQGIEVRSMRLDRYYSFPRDVERFPKAMFYLIPRKDTAAHMTLQHSWIQAMRSFVENPVAHLEQYYRREHSEAAYSADKRVLGWTIAQRREDRINTADQCHATWHNLLNLYGPDRPPPGEASG